jgi:D-hydroxyproline dehydrogenase subunit gamma
MFKQLPDDNAELVTVIIEEQSVKVPSDYSVAAAVLANWTGPSRTTPVSGAPRGPYCMMGVCFDCLMEIDGVPNQQACMIPVAEGMSIRRQDGARGVEI